MKIKKQVIRGFAVAALAAAAVLPLAAKDRIVIVSARPDDLISSIGFCLLAREKFDVHVMDLTHGERGPWTEGLRGRLVQENLHG